MAFDTSIHITVDNREANKRIAETQAKFTGLSKSVRRDVRTMNSDMAELGTPLERTQARISEMRRAFTGMRSDLSGIADALRSAQGQAVSLVRAFSNIGSGGGGGAVGAA